MLRGIYKSSIVVIPRQHLPSLRSLARDGLGLYNACAFGERDACHSRIESPLLHRSFANAFNVLIRSLWRWLNAFSSSNLPTNLDSCKKLHAFDSVPAKAILTRLVFQSSSNAHSYILVSPRLMVVCTAKHSKGLQFGPARAIPEIWYIIIFVPASLIGNLLSRYCTWMLENGWLCLVPSHLDCLHTALSLGI